MSKTMTKERRKKIYDMTRGKCFYCGYDIDLENFHVDHFIPKAKGGKMRENLVPACPQCNMIVRRPIKFYFEKRKFLKK